MKNMSFVKLITVLFIGFMSGGLVAEANQSVQQVDPVKIETIAKNRASNIELSVKDKSDSEVEFLIYQMKINGYSLKEFNASKDNATLKFNRIAD